MEEQIASIYSDLATLLKMTRGEGSYTGEQLVRVLEKIVDNQKVLNDRVKALEDLLAYPAFIPRLKTNDDDDSDLIEGGVVLD